MRSQFHVRILSDFIGLSTGPVAVLFVMHVSVAIFGVLTQLSNLSFTCYCRPINKAKFPSEFQLLIILFTCKNQIMVCTSLLAVATIFTDIVVCVH